MIRYRLVCKRSHEFEAWFPSSDGYEAQAARGLIACPDCGSKKVSKALMAPNVVTSERKEESAGKRRKKRAPAMPAPEAGDAAGGRQAVLQSAQREMLRELKALREKLLADSEYVGPRFAEEARKIHEEEAPQRGIYGEASLDEVKALNEDGIDVLPIPVLPDDQN